MNNSLLNRIINIWWVRHLLFWIFILCYFTWGIGFINQPPKEAFFKSFALTTGGVFIVYPFLYFLVPEYLVKRKIFMFFLGYALLIVSGAIVRSYLMQLTGIPFSYMKFQSKIGNNLLPYTNICAIAATFKLIRQALSQKQEAEIAVLDKTIAEQELLKSQIHPRFLFNTLNSLNSHTRQNTDNAPQIVLTLSELLRFMIYESQADFIPLTQEIKVIRNYVELEKLRFGDEMDISLNFSGDLEGKLIQPLLLLPLLENSFKHGTNDNIEKKWISLDLNVANNTMYFNLTNSRSPNAATEMKEPDNGMSLSNVKRRIELFYPGKHVFMSKEDEDIFLVKMELKLKKGAIKPYKSLNTQNIEYGLEMPSR